MKAIVIKDENGKVFIAEQLSDVSTATYIKLVKEAKETQERYEQDKKHLEDRVTQLEEDIENLYTECENLKHEIAVDRGEVEESEEHE